MGGDGFHPTGAGGLLRGRSLHRPHGFGFREERGQRLCRGGPSTGRRPGGTSCRFRTNRECFRGSPSGLRLLDPSDLQHRPLPNWPHLVREPGLTPYQFYLLPFGGLETAVQNLAAHVRFLRIWFLPFTIPTTAIAILLGRVGFDLGLTGRRRELAVLRARGISVRGVRGFLLVETTVVSLLAALIGLGFAVLLSRIIISLPMFAPFTVNGPRAVPAEVAITLTTLGFTIGFAWLLAWLASRRALKFALSKDIVTGFRAYHEEEMSLPHRGSRDFLLVAVGVAGLLLVVLVALLDPFSVIAAWLGFPTIILAPVAPILLAVGLVRYLTRGTTKVYRALARLLRPFLGKVEPLVDKNLARAPRRASNIAMIVTFAMAFLVAMPVLTASSEAYLDEQARWGTPSDIVMSTSFS